MERIIQVQSFSIQSLYSWTKLTRRNERHLIIKLCTYIVTLLINTVRMILRFIRGLRGKLLLLRIFRKERSPHFSAVIGHSSEGNKCKYTRFFFRPASNGWQRPLKMYIKMFSKLWTPVISENILLQPLPFNPLYYYKKTHKWHIVAQWDQLHCAGIGK